MVEYVKRSYLLQSVNYKGALVALILRHGASLVYSPTAPVQTRPSLPAPEAGRTRTSGQEHHRHFKETVCSFSLNALNRAVTPTSQMQKLGPWEVEYLRRPPPSTISTWLSGFLHTLKIT